jgi:hypothetical protein
VVRERRLLVYARLGLFVAVAAASVAACESHAGSAATDAGPQDAAALDAAAPDADVRDAPAAGDAGPAAWFYGTDCPPAAPASVPPASPRILVLGPGDIALPLAAYLQGMLAADAAYTAPAVEAASTSDGGGGVSLMNFFYQPDGRDARLAWLAEPWSYVVLLEDAAAALYYPELYFEGVRALGCNARAAGAQPIVLVSWSCHDAPGVPSPDTALRGELAYRVANGTSAVVAPAGYARAAIPVPAAPGADGGFVPVRPCSPVDSFVAAATLYSTLTGRDAAATSYRPLDIAADEVAPLAATARDTVATEAARVHYQEPFHGVVELRTAPAGGDFWFMDSGSSSEQIWFDRMTEILPQAGYTPQGTQIGYTNPYKSFDAACLDNAVPYFQQQQYRVLLARSYAIDAATIAATGAQTDLQVQIWDRHADADPSDGLAAVAMLESMSQGTYAQARSWGAAMVPYHLMFAKLKTMRPSVQLLSDGTHATYPVGYGLATMSIVARTGRHPQTDGLDADTALAAQLAEETIRQLANLSVTGGFVADDPGARPRPACASARRWTEQPR